MKTEYEVIVVGFRGLGSAALYWLSKDLGSEVLGLAPIESRSGFRTTNLATTGSRPIQRMPSTG
jgi:hypothetical protein